MPSILSVKRRPPNSIDADVLRSLKIKGVNSPVLDARLRFTEIEGVARYVRMMRGVERVFPNMLPTQASGRWSTTDPPLVNFPADCINPECSLPGEHSGSSTCWSARDVVGPDPGWWHLHWDLDAVEARLAAAEAGDQDDLQAFAQGYDIHTITTCRAFKQPLPPVLTKALHESPECEPWRQSWSPPWSGAEDRRRHLMKTMRYATQFCISPKGVLQARDIEKLGLTPQEIVRFAMLYLRSKPTLMARKRQVWDDCAKSGLTRTWYGRRRRLYGDWASRAKEGWSHRISGTVSDYQNQAIIKITLEFPQCHLVLNTHDGCTLAFPEATSVAQVLPVAKRYVEQVVTSPTGHKVEIAASWEFVASDLTKRSTSAIG